MAASLVCVLAACCWPSTDKDVADTIKQCMADDDQTAHTAMRTLAAQAEDDETWSVIVMKVVRKFGHKQWRKKDGHRTDAATQLLLLMDLMPLCDSRRAINASEDMLSFARDEANPAQLRNALVVWNAFAGKFDMRVASRMLTDELLQFLIDNANRRYTTDPEVCIHALLTLERFSKTGPDNARRISQVAYRKRLEEVFTCSPDPQLRLICEWALGHNRSTESGLQKKRKRDENKGPNQVTREKKSKRIPFISMNTDFLNGNESHNSESDGRSCYTVGYDGDGDDEVGYDGYDSLHVDTHTDLESRMLYKQVRLNAADRTNFVKVSSDGSEVRNDSTSFGSIRANCYISAVDSNGNAYGDSKWYYEITLRTGGIMQVGWATKDCVFKPEEGSGIGDDFYSYAYDGCRRQAWHAASAFPCGHEERRWKAGDVVGCLFDAEAGIISFTLNGKFGSEYGYRTFVGVRRGLAFYPALSIGAFQQCRVNFGGEPFKFKPVGYRSVNEFATLYDIPLEATELDRPEIGQAPFSYLNTEPGKEGASCMSLDDDRVCKICYAHEREVKLHPCGHQEICFACSIRLVVCPVCRCAIEDREHVLTTNPENGVENLGAADAGPVKASRDRCGDHTALTTPHRLCADVTAVDSKSLGQPTPVQ